ncbi:MAG TPA: antitoxin HicB [Clostridiales bacterium]|nr:antitoxin HicB [Clostridiales bacterium]
MAAKQAEYIVNLIWDDEATVWVASSDDIPGLVLESGSLDALIERVRFAIPELLSLNGAAESKKLFVCYRSERHEQVIA